ncbi:MAG: hypothetical protein WD342_20895 [Verrucomicrobiales bacterium]
MGMLKGGAPKGGAKKLKAKDRWIASLARGLHGIGQAAVSDGAPRSWGRDALARIEHSLKTRTEMQGGSRGYLDFLHRFLKDGDLMLHPLQPRSLRANGAMGLKKRFSSTPPPGPRPRKEIDEITPPRKPRFHKSQGKGVGKKSAVRKVADHELQEVHIKRNRFHGEWNYEIHPTK